MMHALTQFGVSASHLALAPSNSHGPPSAHRDALSNNSRRQNSASHLSRSIAHHPVISACLVIIIITTTTTRTHTHVRPCIPAHLHKPGRRGTWCQHDGRRHDGRLDVSARSHVRSRQERERQLVLHSCHLAASRRACPRRHPCR